MSKLLLTPNTKSGAATILGKERAISAGQHVKPSKIAGKTVEKAAAKLGHYGGEATAKQHHHKGKKR